MRLFFLVLLSFLFCSPFAQSQHYLWPTDSGQYLSSTFGETRSAHFHAGLDIKTWGREGYRVFAARDGVLYRLRVTERGYGKAIYLLHPDSTYTVYAHLQRFNNEFMAITDSIRMQNLSYEMDAIVDTMGIQVNQGDLIGYTGSTGIGPPHLHFEVRDSLENPVNALTTNLSIKDDLAPVFSSLIVEPITKNSRVEGKPISHFRRAGKIDNTTYNFGEIELAGKAGLAVNVFDQANDVFNAYAVHSLALIHRSDTLFYEELNTLTYDNPGEMLLDRIAPFGSKRRGHQRLYAKDGHQNPFYLITKPEAQIQAEDTAQTYTIIASDYFGNTAIAKLTVLKAASSTSSKTPDLSIPTKNWYWTENWASPDFECSIDLRTDIQGFPWDDSQQLVWSDSSKVTNFARIFPDKLNEIRTPDYQLFVRFPEQTFFDTLTVSASKFTDNDEVHLSIQPQMLAVKSNFVVNYFMGERFEPDNNYRLFRKDPDDGELSYVDSDLIGRTVHAFPSKLGEFIIKADNNPPEISDFRIYKTNYGEWRASVRVKDELTGIESSSAEFKVNGKKGIAEYDYEEGLLIYYLPGFLPDSVNTAHITIKDKAGNQTSLVFKE